MSTNVASTPRPTGVLSPLLPLILQAGIIVGVLDAVDGVIFFWVSAGKNPIQVLQYIASGVLGGNAYHDGLSAAVVGLVAHFVIALVVATIYLVAANLEWLRSHALVSGLVYGAAVYLVMNYVVLPHTATVPTYISPAAFVNGIIGHALFVGLPPALIARRGHAVDMTSAR